MKRSDGASGVTASLRLDHASIITPDLDRAASFYTDVLGLQLRVVEEDPNRAGRRRAMLIDASGHDVLELIESLDLSHPAIPGRGGLHHLGFRLDPPSWRALRARLDETGTSYQETRDCLFVRDHDGLVLEVEQG